MPKVLFSHEQIVFLKKYIKNTRISVLAEMFNNNFNASITTRQLLGWCNYRKLHNGIPKTAPKKAIGDEYTKRGYVFVKVSNKDKANSYYKGTWKLKHVLIWEQANGKIPKGYRVTFLDGNKSNFSLDNLALITSMENVQLNAQRLRTNDKDLTKTGLMIIRLDMAIKKRMRDR